MRTLPLPAAVLRVAAFLTAAVLIVSAAEGGDSLSKGQSIKRNESLVSALQGSFRLGFFTTRPDHTYLGIWYNRIPNRTVVWVANRLRPLPDDAAGSLTLEQDGSLVLADAAGAVYWSTDPPARTVSNPVVRLLEEGNLVVSGDGGGVRYAWESFAEPTDTLLPGMKIGVNRRTGESYNLTAWKAADDPSPGDYSITLLDRGVPQMFIVKGTVPVWRGGPWVEERFTGVPAMKSNGMFTYGFTATSDELYLKFDRWSTSMLTRIVVPPSGIAEHWTWDPGRGSWVSTWESVKDTCDSLAFCGANAVCVVKASGPACSCLEGFHRPQQPDQARRRGAAGGAAAVCQRNRPLTCAGGKDAFVLVSGVKLPDSSMATSSKVGFGECRAACLGNCSCTAFTSGADGGGCITWFGNLTDIRLYSSLGQDLYLRVPSDGRKNGKNVIIIVTIIVSVLIPLIVVMLAVLLCLYRRRRRRMKEMQPSIESWQRQDDDEASYFALINFNTLEIATDNFSLQNKLGEGGYGPVYKGKLPNEQYVAIKRLSKDSTQGIEQFKSEIKLVAKLQHTNLVRLLGCCIENEEKILVYEYMGNQSLDNFIFDANKGKLLDWAKRKHIIEGITQGLLYLHKYSRLRVVHRDLKASNILLDDEWNPKISDFGLARIFSWNDAQVNTKRIIGTYGYMPPEYAMRGIFSTKSDVFSFGVLLLEILSGKKNTSIHDFGISGNLPGHAWELWREGKQLELVDPAMGNEVAEHEFSRCVHVALLCVQENPTDRPTMLDIISMLNSDPASSPMPNQPAFFFVRHVNEEGNNLGMEHISSSNSVTLTSIEGR